MHCVGLGKARLWKRLWKRLGVGIHLVRGVRCRGQPLVVACSLKTKAQRTESCRPDFFFSRGPRIPDAEGYLYIIQPMMPRKRTR